MCSRGQTSGIIAYSGNTRSRSELFAAWTVMFESVREQRFVPNACLSESLLVANGVARVGSANQFTRKTAACSFSQPHSANATSILSFLFLLLQPKHPSVCLNRHCSHQRFLLRYLSRLLQSRWELGVWVSICRCQAVRVTSMLTKQRPLSERS